MTVLDEDFDPSLAASYFAEAIDFRARVEELEALTPFLCHLNLDCYEGCTCGLDAITGAASLPRCDSHPT